MPRRPAYDYAHEKARAELLDGDPVCAHCGAAPATIADHQPPLALHDHRSGSGCCDYVPSCQACSNAQAGVVSKLVGRVGQSLVRLEDPDPCPPADDPCWDAASWLDELRDPPDDAVWPRFMSAPHPAAVGSYLAAFEAFAMERSGFVPFWWQRLVAARLLEHDDTGRLVWGTWLVSLARQVGKSTLIVELLLFAIHHVRDWFHADDVLFAARSLSVAEDLMAEPLRWAKDVVDYPTKRTPGQSQIEVPDHTASTDRRRLMIRATDASYGKTLGMAYVDEAWDVAARHVTEGIRPTLLAAEGQLGLISTAHRLATSLMLNERQRMFEEMDEPSTRLILEWSTPRVFDIDDVDGWRLASPRWTRFRESMMSDALKAARAGEVSDVRDPDPIAAFEAQYLNRWPAVQTQRGAGEPLFEAGAYGRSLYTSERPTYQRVIAVNDNFGRGLSIAEVGVTPNDHVAMTGWAFDDAGAGWDHLRQMVPAATLFIGATLANEATRRGVTGFKMAGGTETKEGLAVMRQLVESRQLVHDGAVDLADQMIGARVREGASGLMLLGGKQRHDLVIAAAWAVAAVQQSRAYVPGIY